MPLILLRGGQYDGSTIHLSDESIANSSGFQLPPTNRPMSQWSNDPVETTAPVPDPIVRYKIVPVYAQHVRVSPLGVSALVVDAQWWEAHLDVSTFKEPCMSWPWPPIPAMQQGEPNNANR